MSILKHRVFFYRFTMPDPCNSLGYLLKNYAVDKSSDNYRPIRRHGVLFIADRIEGVLLFGRLVKVRIGRVRRIDVPNHKEWYETVKNNNGIEQETHTLIAPSEKIMIVEYNSEAFKILPQYVYQYFRETIDCPSDQIFLANLLLPEDFEKLISSKVLQTFKFSVQGDLTTLLDDFGLSTSRVITGGEGELPFSLSVDAKYGSNRKMLAREAIETLIGVFKRHELRTKTASIQTEEGLFSLISNTLLNDEIFYDPESESRDEIAFSEIKKSYDRKLPLAKEALEILEKEQLDYYDEGRNEL